MLFRSRNLLRSGDMPSPVYWFPKKLIPSFPMMHLLALKTRPCFAVRSISHIRFLSWSVWSIPQTVMSSAMLATPGRSSSISSIRDWKISWLTLRPKGNLCQQYLPKGVLKVVNICEVSSSWILQ